MHPAPSVILFTVLSGAGFGLLVYLGLGLPAVSGWFAFAAWGFGYALAVGGLMASTFHLGHPERALLAFTQWRSSWLSREAWAAVATLLTLAPMALSDWLGLGLPRLVGWAGAGLALATVWCTAMIYAQLKTVPRWHHWLTPLLFLTIAAAGGAILAGPLALGALLALLSGAVLFAAFLRGDTAFQAAGQTLGKATGLDRLGHPSVFEPAHTAGNYLLREMIFTVGRRHAARLRRIALVALAALPALALLLLPEIVGRPLAFLSYLIGAMSARWLFFAEAEHVVGLYYGRHG
jgi:sulfite dehydrogenase (quinone) subunit SoeC